MANMYEGSREAILVCAICNVQKIMLRSPSLTIVSLVFVGITFPILERQPEKKEMLHPLRLSPVCHNLLLIGRLSCLRSSTLALLANLFSQISYARVSCLKSGTFSPHASRFSCRSGIGPPAWRTSDKRRHGRSHRTARRSLPHSRFGTCCPLALPLPNT